MNSSTSMVGPKAAKNAASTTSLPMPHAVPEAAAGVASTAQWTSSLTASRIGRGEHHRAPKHLINLLRHRLDRLWQRFM